ncbi:MAG: hypothetical protein KJZ65_08720 [Phycisphaerales bacterium]|nr:hypothetical protein [Phycisphaerales bacterium]
MDTKLMVVGVAAAVAVGVAAWMGYARFGGARAVRSPSDQAARQIGQPAGEGEPPRHGGGMSMSRDQAPRWMAEDPAERPGAAFQFVSHSTPSQAASALGAALGSMRDLVEHSAELVDLGSAPKFGVVDQWLDFVQPLVGDDQPGFVAAYERLGGLARAPARDGESAPPRSPGEELFGRLRGHFAGASIDTGRIVVRRPDVSNPMEVPVMMRGEGMPRAAPGDIPMMMARTAAASESGGPATGSASLAIPLEMVFVGAGEAFSRKAPVVELWAPMRLSGQKGDSPDVGASTYLVWNAGTRAWQPLAIRLKLRSEEAKSRIPRRGGEGG